MGSGKRPGTASRVAVIDGAIRNQDASGVDLVWETPAVLSIRYLHARQSRLLSRQVAVSGRAISVVERFGFENPAAPPGGMLHNLRRRP